MTDDQVEAVPSPNPNPMGWHAEPVPAALRIDESTPNLLTSPTIGKIAVALAKVQKALKQPSKRTDNSFFKSKYADLHEVWAAAAGLMSDAGLTVVQAPSFSTSELKGKVIGVITISTTIIHGESGEWMTNVLRGMTENISPQNIGSGISYFRRYGLQPMLMLTPDDGSDDDGERAEGRTPVPAEDKPSVEDIEKTTKAIKDAKTHDALKKVYEAIPQNHRHVFNKLVKARKETLEKTPGVAPETPIAPPTPDAPDANAAPEQNVG